MMAIYYRVRIYQKDFFNYLNKILKILPRIQLKEKWVNIIPLEEAMQLV